MPGRCSSLSTGATSHKIVAADVSRILYLYYTDTVSDCRSVAMDYATLRVD